MNEEELRRDIMNTRRKNRLSEEQRRLRYPLLYPFDQDYEEDEDDEEP